MHKCFLESLMEHEFAGLLGFDSWDDLLMASNLLFNDGGVKYYITRLPDDFYHPLTGSHYPYVVWDTAVLSLHRVSFFRSWEQALRVQYENFLVSVRNGSLSFRDWLGPDPASFDA